MSVLVQRSVLGRSGYPLDQIHIRGIAARGFHGVLQRERDEGQDFSADVTLYLDTRAAARGDDLTETVNYALVAQDVHAILSGEPVNLVETVAERIADAVLARPQVISVDVTVHKPQAPIPLPFDDVVVTIHRDRVNVPVVSASDELGSARSDEPQAPSTDLPAPSTVHEPLPAPVSVDRPAAAPVPVQQVRPVVISRVATDELAQVSSQAEPEPVVTAGTQPVATTEPGPVDVPDGTPPVPGPDDTLLVPRHGSVPEPVRPPTPEEIAALEEQARASAALRRPEVFGTTRITSGERPDVLLDGSGSTTSFPRVPAVDPQPELDTRAEPDREPAPDVPHVPDTDPVPDLEPAPAEPTVRLAQPEPWPAPEPGAQPGFSLHDADALHPSETGVGEDDTHGLAGGPSALDATTVLDPVQLLDRMDARPTVPVDVVIAIGANLGDAQETLRQAVSELAAVESIEVVAVGPLARTAAVGGPDQPDFLNTVVLARTTSSARELLHACQRIEHDHGRQRIERWGPRTLDVDIIVYDGLIDSTDDLELPHPRAHERSFVLAPWAHVDPDAVLPGLGGGPVAALAATAPDRDGIRWLALDWLHESDEPSEARRAAPPSIAPQAPAVTHPHDAQQAASSPDLDRSAPTEAPAPRE